MSKGYQGINMVAQLGNDPSAVEEQQLVLAAQQHQQLAQQQLAAGQPQVPTLEQLQQQALARRQQQLEQQQFEQLGAGPSTMPLAAGAVAREASVMSLCSSHENWTMEPNDGDVISDDPLTVSPEAKRKSK